MKILSETQEILNGMVEDKIKLHSRATDKHHEQKFEELKELEEKTKRGVQKKHDLWRIRMKEMKQEGCTDLEAREG